MKMFSTILIFLGFIFAEVAVGKERSPQATVWTRGSSAKMQTFFPKDKYQMQTVEEENRRLREQGYLPPPERQMLFMRAGVLKTVAPLDELAKDELVMTAWFESTKEIRKYFPMLSDAQARLLKVEVEKMK